MGRKSKYTIEQKIEAVQDYKSGKRGRSQICHDLKLCKSGKALYRWVSLYDEYGEIGFLPKRRNKAYSKELKEKAINDYLLLIARLSEGKKVELNKAKIDAHLNKIKLITSLSSNYLKKKAGMISC